MWHSVKREGFPLDDVVCLVTVEITDGTRYVEDSYTHIADVSDLVDKRTNEGKRYIAEHPNGVWRQWHSDGFWEDAYDDVIAWKPYPEPYEGD